MAVALGSNLSMVTLSCHPIYGAGKAYQDLTTTFCRREASQERKEILLGMKKRGFGVGKWNGFGGKLEAGESVEQAAIRELREESQIKCTQLKKVGLLLFTLDSYPKIMRMHVFEAVNYEGEPQETDEMRPQWFDERNIPFQEMWADDTYWMPLLLKGQCFQGEFNYGDENTVLRHVLHEVEEVE
ncbi:unnamed protein product [Chrysoparadoxa australica]